MMDGIYKSPLFVSLQTNEVDKLLHQRCKLLEYNAGELIALQSDVYRSLLCMDSGTVRGEMTHSDGERIVIEEIEAPRIIAPAFFFASNNLLPVDIVAKTPVSIVSISKSAFTEIVQADTRVLQNFLRQISDRSQFLSERLRIMRFGTIQSKLAHYLWERVQASGSENLVLAHTQQELADMFGVTRPALARSIKILADNGILYSRNKRIQILDSTKLRKLL